MPIQPPDNPRKGRAGVSLLQAVLALAVIGMMIASLYPAYQRSTRSARASRCVANLRQLGVAFHLYISDHNGNFCSDTAIYPSTHATLPGILDYTGAEPDPKGTVWTCPELQAHAETATNYQRSRFLKTYSANRAATNEPPDGQININRIPYRSKMALIFDGAVMDGGTPWNHRYHEAPTNRPSGLSRLCFPHGDLSNVCFLDGHVRPVTREEMLDSNPTSHFWWGGAK